MKIIQWVEFGESSPRFMRTAYLDICTLRSRNALIGLHLLIRLARRLCEWSHSYNLSALEEMQMSARMAERAKWHEVIFRLQGNMKEKP